MANCAMPVHKIKKFTDYERERTVPFSNLEVEVGCETILRGPQKQRLNTALLMLLASDTHLLATRYYSVNASIASR